jgi:hypothetical protein
MNAERKLSRETMRVLYFFTGIFILIFLMNVILTYFFKLPGQFHFALFPAAVIAFYIHFCLICQGDFPKSVHEGFIPYAEGRGKLLIPFALIGNVITWFIPRIKKQKWHKHRGLLIAGPFCLALSLGLAFLLGIPLSWPAVIVSALSITAGYYSISFLPMSWANIGY